MSDLHQRDLNSKTNGALKATDRYPTLTLDRHLLLTVEIPGKIVH